MNATKEYEVEIREFTGSSFGERWDLGYSDNTVANVAEFEDFVDQYVPPGIESEDEPARPFRGIVAGRQWTIPETEEASERQFSAFMRKIGE